MTMLNVHHAFCLEWLKAWTGNQPERLLSFYTEDAYYQDPVHPNGLTGHAALKAYFSKLLAANPDWLWTLEEFIPSEKGFVIKWQADIPILDAAVLTHGVDIVELTAGKISRNEVYFDSSLLRKK